MSWLDLGSEAKAEVCEDLRARFTTARHCGSQKLSLSHTPGESGDLDAILRGGISTGLITELSGEAGVGKTQLCLQLLLNVQRPLSEGGLDGRALYLYTEGGSRPLLNRCLQMAAERGWDGNCLDGLMVREDVADGPALLTILEQAEQELLWRGPEEGQQPVRLIVVDSIAHLFRIPSGDAGAHHYGARAHMFSQVSGKLKQLAYEYQLAVVVTNQVTDHFPHDPAAALKKGSATGGLTLMTSGREVLPALGLAWTNCINQRLFLARCQPQREGSSVAGTRSLRVVFSPYLPPRQCFFVIDRAGIRVPTASEAGSGSAAASSPAGAPDVSETPPVGARASAAGTSAKAQNTDHSLNNAEGGPTSAVASLPVHSSDDTSRRQEGPDGRQCNDDEFVNKASDIGRAEQPSSDAQQSQQTKLEDSFQYSEEDGLADDVPGSFATGIFAQ